MLVELDELLTVATRTLAEAGVAHALIDGCARNVYAPPRSTRDVDWEVTDVLEHVRSRIASR